MPTPADQRLLELLDKWLKSLELHSKYSSLDDENYWKVQPWVEHQRPTRWIIDIAKQKTLALRAQVQERIKTGDAQYSDSMELMIFLANLVGSEHIERFIPMAEPDNERPLVRSAPAVRDEEEQETPADEVTGTREIPQVQPPAVPASVTATREMPTFATPASAGATATREMPIFTPSQPSASVTATREMPRFETAKAPPPPAATPHVARTERKAASKAPAKSSAKPQPKGGAAKGKQENGHEQVIADAVRLMQWGRKWYELPELIARMADRPPLPEVRKILKENKSTIDKKAGKD
jgi:hypothetical protein